MACRAAALPQPCPKIIVVAAIISQPYTRKCNEHRVIATVWDFPLSTLERGLGGEVIRADARGAYLHANTDLRLR